MTALVKPFTAVALAFGLVFAQNGKAPDSVTSSTTKASETKATAGEEKHEQKKQRAEKDTPASKAPEKESSESAKQPRKKTTQEKTAPTEKAEERAEKPPAAEKSMPPKAKKSSNEVTVSRAAIAPAIENREPVGAGESFKKDAVEQLYFFTQVTGVRDTLQVEHRWYHNGNLVQTTRLPVRSIRWRTYSSHSVGEQSAGSWKVEVVNTKTDEVMESISFQIQ